MKILIGEFGQETNTFSEDRFTFEKLAPTGWITPEIIAREYRNTATYLGGAIDAAEESGVEVIPLDSFTVTGGSMMTRECLDYAVEHLLSGIRDRLSGADGLFLAQHGGGAAEGVEDLEIYVLRKIRELTGKDFPIVSSLDMHSNLSPELIALSDGLFVIKEFPHSDMNVASFKAVTELVRMIKTGRKPVMTLVNLPVILPNTTTCTLFGPMKEVKEHFAEYGKNKGFIDCSLVQGYSANDQYYAGVSVLIVSDRDETASANELAEYFWKRRKDFDPKPCSAEAALTEAMAYTGDDFTVINESSDNPGSGCPGDGTHLLRELVKRDIPGSIFAYIYDPEAVEQASKAGVGNKVDLFIGGKTVPINGEPLFVRDAEVLAVSDGNFTFRGAWKTGAKGTIGRSVRIQTGNVEIIIGSVRDQTFDDGPLLTTGTGLEGYRIIALKSANHFRGFYQSRAGKIIPCETPGLRSTDLKSYPYKNIRHPIYPLDEGVHFLND